MNGIGHKIALFIDSPDPGGAETCVVNLSFALQERGWSPEILIFDNPWVRDRAEQLGIPAYELPDYGLYKSATTMPRYCWRLSRLLRRREYELVHSHLFGAVVAGSIASFKSMRVLAASIISSAGIS